MTTCLQVSKINDQTLHDLVEEYFTTENFGVRSTPAVKSDAEIRAENILKATMLRVDGRFQIGLLWKHDEIRLPDNYKMAEQRFLGIERKFKRDNVFAAAYKSVIQSYLEKNYCRKLTQAEAAIKGPRVWYLPHFAVKNPNKHGKIRLVFDAAAAFNNVSLNSFLLKGPQDYQPMPTVLYNFRIGAIGVCGDIKEMFHQILVRPEDRCAQRFLWRNNPNCELEVYEMQVMTFGAACSPCAAQYIKTVNAMGYKEKFPRAVEAIVKHHYVDDFVNSFPSVEKAIAVTTQVREIHKAAGLDMCAFISNSDIVVKSLRNTAQLEDATAEKVLGMYWKPEDDTFRYELKFHRVDADVVSGNRPPTKRELCSYIMSIFDPMGFLCQLTVGAKLLLREVWQGGVTWDQPLPEDMYECWKVWQKEVERTTTIRIPRYYFQEGPPKELQLHVFVDASEEAFSAVCYWRYKDARETFRTALIGTKTKCAPIKCITIPRLELQATVLGVRLSQMILEEHKLVCTRILWSDSTTVISWLNSQHRRYKPFVAHRIAEILAVTRPGDWNWVPTNENVADEATRRSKNLNFNSTSRWLNGPEFLSLGTDSWPKAPIKANNDLVCSEILPAKRVLLVDRISFIEFDRFSSYNKLKRTVAWILRFVGRTRRKFTDQKEYGLTATELDAAEKIMCRQIQATNFSVEIKLLREGQPLAKDSLLYTLPPFIDNDQILRVGGRIQAASWLPFDSLHQIVLPTRHKLTLLIVTQYHIRMKHHYTEATIGEIRQKFWIPQLR
ncbi:PREDICTED: uncharacterized protein LOC108376012 [Rhagoletis zephyria]|uniref:uncharacterized protein LOC108376012 n=1 Tax=Rhagoletis zephyria TaxID=28612 RepID=UPI0008113BD7|nr:PREDICTED: uncharacterized protein LOC108376012 [Rhagoletis zephyria]